VTPLGGKTKVWGTVCGGGAGAKKWTIRLDRAFPTSSGTKVQPDAEWPAVGDVLEAKADDGSWRRATVQSVETEVDWYEGVRKPSTFIVKFTDGGEEVERPKGDLRHPVTQHENTKDLEDLKKYGMVPVGAGMCLAVCAEEPRSYTVGYKPGSSVGDEIAAFKLDRSCPLAPLSIAAFQSHGPAQEIGIKTGWYLDLEGTLKGPSKKAFAEILSGIGPITYDASASVSASMADSIADTAFGHLEEVLERFNSKLLAYSSNIKLIFTNSCAKEPVALLPEAVIQYSANKAIKSEIANFTADGEALKVVSFNAPGPAQAAGVGLDWILDIGRTLGSRNPGKVPEITKEVLLANPAQLLEMAGVTLIFHQPNPGKSQRFEASGEFGPSWNCPELPGDVADFHFATDGDGVDYPDRRWGFFALVVGKGGAQPSQEKVDELATKWSEAIVKANGVPEEPAVERDDWDEARLRALCDRHGWDFEWMTEDGERRRRAKELHGGDFGSADGEMKAAAEAIRKYRAHAVDTSSEVGTRSEASSGHLPDGFVETAAPAAAGSSGHPGRRVADLLRKAARGG